MTCHQVEESPGLPGTPRSWKGSMEQTLLRSLQNEPTLLLALISDSGLLNWEKQITIVLSHPDCGHLLMQI